MQLGRYLLDLSTPRIMGVLNTTPDSFSDGGAVHGRDGHLDMSRVLRRVEAMVEEGADIIDVGGESTRPGAASVTVAEELQRVVPVVEVITARFDVPVSVDTSTPEVMTAAAEAGASLINDVRALRRPGALQAAAETGLPVCLMHMSGEPDSMQQRPEYEDVVQEVKDFLAERVATCEAAGIGRDKLLLDPGFGFGKTLQHNLDLFRGLGELQQLGMPLLVGVSRKSMIGALLDKPVEQRMVGSVAMAMLAAQQGVSIVRVHDVSATADALKIMTAIER
ncbi:dihydropteroate synthase [Porticoccus litoralis]|jgi:dihydropteroate synthase|uniref:Dihydropteroate synthase n=1 Tax=Porticoccus litoralis TaxID=434086 RepID=A0AAW8B5C0_9GAMM|nr:dihydropteroate synthase [Porticoccus litoralis]MDP1520595.1 dihydropteroate synthase [Porticoccus litoralis]